MTILLLDLNGLGDTMGDVAVLFARSDSVYKSLEGVTVFDRDRDARSFKGGMGVVAHPPCALWSRMRAFARRPPEEADLAYFALDQVRQHGGVLEHPAGSAFWPAAGLPGPGCGVDEFGGWTLPVDQFWFGHVARKRTLLYIVGVSPRGLPLFPMVLGVALKRCDWISPKLRESTPRVFAEWLVNLSRRCHASLEALRRQQRR